ncbi:hypothetical protein VTK73DRAFT_4018 [Phialemonium thermophilum]|uniref:Uncharacterized protein n=1 Tax=Phialemonium thermophilum TaxID=223376 RepID=A0ABR3VCE6_9PEZI
MPPLVVASNRSRLTVQQELQRRDLPARLALEQAAAQHHSQHLRKVPKLVAPVPVPLAAIPSLSIEDKSKASALWRDRFKVGSRVGV